MPTCSLSESTHSDPLSTYSKMVRLIISSCLVLLSVLISGCSDEDNGDSSSESEKAVGLSIDGTVFKGPVAGAELDFFDLDGNLLGETTTDDEGSYQINVEQAYRGIIRIVATGGNYIDEATGLEKPLSEPLITYVVVDEDSVTAHLTPVTHIVATLIAATSDEGFQGDTLEERVSNQIEETNADVAGAFGLDVDVVSTDPVNLMDTNNNEKTGGAVDYALVIAGIARIVQDNVDEGRNEGDSVEEVLQQFAADLQDNGELNDTDLLLQLNKGINDFIASEQNQAQASLNGSKLDGFFQLVPQESLIFSQDAIIKTFGDAPFTNSVSGGSGSGTLSFESDNPNVANVDNASGEVTIVGAGSATITAKKASDDYYLEASSTYTLNVVQAAQAGLKFADVGPVNKAVGDAPFLNTVSGGAGSGALNYSSDNTSVAQVNASTGEVTILTAGNATITVTKAGDSNYLSANTQFELVVSPGAQTVLNFQEGGEITKTFGEPNFGNPVSGGSGSGALLYSSDNTNVASVDKDTGEVTITGAGEATIIATKAADANYLEASASYDLVVGQAEQSALSFDEAGPIDRAVGNDPFSNTASGGSGTGELTYTSSNEAVAQVNSSTGVVTVLTAGDATITATKAGDTNYLQSSIQYTLNVARGEQAELTFTRPGTRRTRYGVPNFFNTVTGGSGTGAVTYASSDSDIAVVDPNTGVVSLTGIGDVTITATKVEDDNYLEASASYQISVERGSQIVSFDEETVLKSLGDASFTTGMYVPGIGEVSYASSDTDVVTVNPNTGEVTIVGLGNATITANIAEGPLYNAGEGTYNVDVRVPVNALYSNGSNWNEYVKNDGGDVYSATDTACQGTESPGYTACIHGGEKRAVEATGYAACTNLSASDALGAFRWQCDDSTDPVRFVTVGLQEDKNLSNLIDFDSAAWHSNSVTIHDGGLGSDVITTHSTQWWANPIVVDNDGGSLDSQGTVYIVNEDVAANYTIAASNIGLVVKPGKQITQGVSNQYTINVPSVDFLWIEGSLVSVVNGHQPIYINTVRFSVLKNIRFKIDSGATAMYFSNSHHNRIDNIKMFGGGNIFHFDNTNSFNMASRVVSHGATGAMNVYGFRNSVIDLLVTGSSRAQTYVTNDAMISNATYSHVTNTSGGFIYVSGESSVLSGALTAGASLSTPLYLLASAKNLTVTDVAADYLHNASSVFLFEFTTMPSYFTGELRLGANPANPCSHSPSFGFEGLSAPTCANQNGSDANLVQPIDIATSFVGPVMADDASNTSDINGAAVYSTSIDPFNFDTPYRAWSKDETFLSIDATGQWNTGDGRIVDWSLNAADNQVRAVRAAAQNGDSANTITHTWSDTSTITFLRNSVEILDDGIGNDDGFCESNEACLYTPNIGAYQGHGEKVQRSWTDGDTLTGITLYEYETNGY